MKSSEKRGGFAGVRAAVLDADFLSSGPIYGLLALYMPLSILFALVFLLGGLLPLPMFRMMLCGALAGLIASAYYDLIRDMLTNHTAAHIRGGAAVTVIAYLGVSLCEFSLPLAERFALRLPNLLSALAGLYMWAMVVFLKKIFRGMKRFEHYLETSKGAELRKKIDSETDLIDINAIAEIRNLYIGQIAALWLAAIVCSFIHKGLGQTGLPLPLTIFLLIITAGAAVLLGFFSLVKQSYRFAHEGIDLPAPVRRQRLFAIVIFSALACLIAAPLSSDRSILPLSLIGALFDWLFRMIRRPAPLLPADFYEPEPLMPAPMVPPKIEGLEYHAPWDGWKYVRYAAIALAVFTFIWFMVKPLLAKGFFSDNTRSVGEKIRRILS
jgi:hypothetical protein